jgi:putative peptidoglycan lipid II flippase
MRSFRAYSPSLVFDPVVRSMVTVIAGRRFVSGIASRSQRAIVLSLISAFARAPGLLIPLLIASYYGAGAQTDAYFISYSAALLVGGTVAQGIEVAIVPFAAGALSQGRETGKRFLDGTSVRTTLAAGVLWLLVAPLAALLSQPESRRQVMIYAACFAPLVVLWCTSSVYAGGMVSQDSIGYATGSTLCRGLVGLVVLLMAPKGFGLSAVALGIGLGELVRAWLLRSRLLRSVSTEPYRPSKSRPFGRAAVAQVLAGIAGNSAPVAERFLAGSLGAGAVSRLEYASKLIVIPGLVFDGALAPLLLARWSQRIAVSREPLGRVEVIRAAMKGFFIAAVISVFVYLVADAAVRILLHHGRFHGADAAAVTSLLRLLTIGFVASMTALIVERYYLASAKNRLLAALSVGRLSIRVLTAIVFLPRMQLLAFAIGFAAAEFAYLTALLINLPRAPSDQQLAQQGGL